jgi:pyruvate/2-oxoglutarate dehydrogenase complex dihydrolipoamide acyltransferase (E2) component
MMIMLVPAVREKAVVENGQVVVRPMLKLCATFDHRVVDGVHAAKLCTTLRELLADPEKHLA